MNLNQEEEKTSEASRAKDKKRANNRILSKKHYQENPEYYKKYYQERKDNWNDYTPKICECGLSVASLTIHKKTKLHNKLMVIKSSSSPAVSTIELASVPSSG
jgi:hypothetical protein